MKHVSRKKLVVVHWIDVSITVIFSIIIYSFFDFIYAHKLTPIIDVIAHLGFWGILISVGLGTIAICFYFPRGTKAAVASIKRFPFHFGIISKIALVICIYFIAVCFRINMPWPLRQPYSSSEIVDIVCVLIVIVLGVASDRLLLVFLVPPHTKKTKVKNQSQENLETWFNDDVPIETLEDNRYPQHEVLARRMLDRLITITDSGNANLSNLALIGPYGSGKTSVCNLIQDIYRKRMPHDEKRYPNILFCRYEAWQFITAEAAVENLYRKIADTLFGFADTFELINIPNRYINAISQVPSVWSKIFTPFLQASKDPVTISRYIGHLAVRLGIHIVVFIDDLDRIEYTAEKAQHAVTRALNQLQYVPNVHYVICAGQIPAPKTHGDKEKMTLDLMKLTRHQELMPSVTARETLDEFTKLRENATKDKSIVYVWQSRTQNDEDLLRYNPFDEALNSLNYAHLLIELVNTPRLLCSVFRETERSWEQGLKGEIDWCDLLLLNALKAAEPDIEEWVLRDKSTFLLGSAVEFNDKDKEKRAQQVLDTLRACLQSREGRREEVVIATLKELFPNFGDWLGDKDISGKKDIDMSKQRVAIDPVEGRSYLERYAAKCVPNDLIPDQSTLQYIRKINENGFDNSEFHNLYLSSYEKLTGDINKLKQFAVRLNLDNAFFACNAILELLKHSDYPNQWYKRRDFIEDMIPDVYFILEKHFFKDEREQIEKWLADTIRRYAKEHPFIANMLLHFTSGGERSILGPQNSEILTQDLSEVLRKKHLDENISFANSLIDHITALTGVIDILQKHKDYSSFRDELTEKLLAEVDNEDTHRMKALFLMTMVYITTPARRGKISVDEYEMKYAKNRNEKQYDMSQVLPVIKKWKYDEIPDKVGKKAFKIIKQACFHST